MNISLGTTATKIIDVPIGFKVSFVIQNLSANNVYLLDSSSGGTANSIQIASSVSLSVDDFDKDVWVVADGASSDVRYIEWNRLVEQ